MRTVVRTLIAGALAIIGTGAAGMALAGPAFAAAPAQAAHSGMPAHGSALGLGSPATAQDTAADSSSSELTVSIDSVGPNRYATPGATIVVNGTVTNHTGAPVDDVQVQLWTSGVSFNSPSVMEQYYNNEAQFYGSPIPGATWQDSNPVLHTNTTVSWSISFSVSNTGYSGFNVYPLVAQASSGLTGGDAGLARTLLPYDPGSGAGSDAPQKLDIAWIWPLEDKPQQGPCQDDLASSQLAGSFASGGRLNGLLSAGLKYAGTTKLTWAVDPALLSDASVMSGPYKVGGDALCTDTTVMPASQPASAWLSGLRGGTSSDPMFLTGYADPDVSALTHGGLSTQIAQAYSLGNSVAGQLLGKSFGSGAKIAWPDGGFADASVLGTLAKQAGVSTTVLSSSEMPVTGYGTPYLGEDAVGPRVQTGSHSQMNVLLSDSAITSLLGSATASSSASAQFAVTQDFLAETAMLVAEAPSSQRSVVIAPPSRWDPSASEASALLKLTSSPWLTPVTLSSLTSRKAIPTTDRAPLPASQGAPLQLSKGYLASVRAAVHQAGQYTDLLYRPVPQTTQQLSIAVAVTESAAWRGNAYVGGRTALARLKAFFSEHEKQVKVISSNKVLLAGTSGDTPLSVSNGLTDAIQVQVRVSVPPGSQLTVGNLSLIVIPAGQIKTIGMKVHSPALGSTLVQLQLLTKDGTPLPGATQALNVETTRFGRTLLILIGVALVVLVLASLARGARRTVVRLRNGGGGHHVRGKNVKSGGASDHGAALSSARTSSASAAGSGSGGTG